MREIVYCLNCGYTGSIEKGDPIPFCPKCGAVLLKMNILQEEWETLTENDKTALKAEFRSQYINSTYLAQIASSLKSIKFWVKFWSVLSLLGVALYVLLFITGSAIIGSVF